MIKSDLLKIKSLSSNNHDDIQDPLPDKLKMIVKQRFQSDILLCFLIFILVFAAHASTAFTSLQVFSFVLTTFFLYLFSFSQYLII
jgi:uncharacterized membrane protein